MSGSNESRTWLALASVLLFGWLIYLLAPILTPFLIAALLAYLGDPLADRLRPGVCHACSPSLQYAPYC
jgi:predicted PurR-regulated permease PerM